MKKHTAETGTGLSLNTVFPLPFVIAFIIDLIYGVFYYSRYNAIALFDTASYYTALNDILEGRPNLLRTPVYPLFLHICSKISPSDLNRTAVTIQITVFFISIWFFAKLLSHFTSNPVLLALGPVFYGCMTPVICLNYLMLTESFSISLSVAFCYLLIQFIKKRSYGYCTACIVIATFLIFLRPAFIYLLIVIGFAAIHPAAESIRKRKPVRLYRMIIPITAFVICITSVLGYMNLNKRYNNYFGLSYVSEMNRFYDVAQADIWKDNPDAGIVENMEELILEGNSPLSAAIETEVRLRNMNADPDRLIEFNKNAISSHRSEYVYYLAKKILTMGFTHTEYNLSNDSYYFKDDADKSILWPGDLMDFNINFVYFICVVSLIGIIAVAVKHKKLLWPEITVLLIVGGQLAVNILAAPAEFHRLNAPCYPFAILLVIAWAGSFFETAHRRRN